MSTQPSPVVPVQPPVIVPEIPPDKTIPFPTTGQPAPLNLTTDKWVILVTGKLKEAQRVEAEPTLEIFQTFNFDVPQVNQRTGKPVSVDDVVVSVFDGVSALGGLLTKNEDGSYSFYPRELFSRFNATANIAGVAVG